MAHADIGSNCVEYIGEEECADYAACQVLIGGEQRHANSIEDVCNDEVSFANDEVSINPELYADCAAKCQTRSCCFQHDQFSCYAMVREYDLIVF